MVADGAGLFFEKNSTEKAQKIPYNNLNQNNNIIFCTTNTNIPYIKPVAEKNNNNCRKLEKKLKKMKKNLIAVLL